MDNVFLLKLYSTKLQYKSLNFITKKTIFTQRDFRKMKNNIRNMFAMGTKLNDLGIFYWSTIRLYKES